MSGTRPLISVVLLLMPMLPVVVAVPICPYACERRALISTPEV